MRLTCDAWIRPHRVTAPVAGIEVNLEVKGQVEQETKEKRLEPWTEQESDDV